MFSLHIGVNIIISSIQFINSGRTICFNPKTSTLQPTGFAAAYYLIGTVEFSSATPDNCCQYCEVMIIMAFQISDLGHFVSITVDLTNLFLQILKLSGCAFQFHQ
jgi:hypothetical protein